MGLKMNDFKYDRTYYNNDIIILIYNIDKLPYFSSSFGMATNKMCNIIEWTTCDSLN